MSLLRWLPAVAVCLISACASAEPPATPVVGDAGSVARGLAYAETNCASCHGISADDPASPNLDAPPFTELANDTPGMTGLALNVWLRSPHEQMPHLLIPADRAEDLWAYMSSLKRQER